MKTLSKREKNRRVFLKYYNSIENKLHGERKLWWDSLSMKARYSVVFKWISYKKYSADLNNKIKFKKFINTYQYNYVPLKTNKRNAIIDHFIS